MHLPRALIFALAAAAVASACGREQDEPLVDDLTGNATAQTDDEGPSTATTPPDTSADSTGGSDDCEGPAGCYDCPPTTPTQVLNACTDATCEPFPNTIERLPRLERDGSLPPIP